jgi:hypothetical protein
MNLTKVAVINTYGDSKLIAEYTTIEEIEKVFNSNSLTCATQFFTIDETTYEIEEIAFKTTHELTVEISIFISHSTN